MRATKLTAGTAAVLVAVTTALFASPSAGAAPSDSTDVVVKNGPQRELEIIRQAPARELEIIRQRPKLRTMTLRADNTRELEIIRRMRANDELEIIRIKRR